MVRVKICGRTDQAMLDEITAKQTIDRRRQ